MNKIMKVIFVFALFSTGISYSQSVYWRQIFGGPYVDIAYNCIELRDGNYMMAGYKEIDVQGQQFQIQKSYIVKFNRYGNILWEKLIGDSLVFNNSLTLVEDQSGNIFLPYYSGYAHLVKLNSEGILIWDRDYTSNNIELFRGVSFENNFKNLVLLGQSIVNNFAGTSSITKLDSSGNIIWTKPYYDSIPSNSYYSSTNNAYLFMEDSYYISGSKGVLGFIIKTDASGNVIWNKRYLNLVGIYSLAQISENTIITSGRASSGLTCQKIDNSGNVIWSRNYSTDSLAGSIGSDKIIKTSDNEFALGTPRGQNFGRLMTIDSMGNILKSRFYYYPSDITIYQNNINNTSDSGYIVAGYLRYWFFNKITPDQFIRNMQYSDYGDKLIDILVYKIDKEGNTVWINNNQSLFTDSFKFNTFPNPFNLSFQLDFNLNAKSKTLISLFDISGKLVKIIEDKMLNQGFYKYNVNTPELSSGVYFLRISSDNKTISKKIVLLK